MKIKETIERECCTYDDLKPYRGVVTSIKPELLKNYNLRFCKHCGQIWQSDSESDGAGGRQGCKTKFKI